MKKYMMTDRPLHPLAKGYVKAFKRGRMSRREFLATMMSLGVTAAGTYALGGLAAPVEAVAAEPKRGGTLRVAVPVRSSEFKDPRTFDWGSHVSRQSCEYLVRWDSDGNFVPRLLESWDISDDATQ